MRIWSSIRWRVLALARACGYAGNPRLFGVEVPLNLVPSKSVLAQPDAGSHEGVGGPADVARADDVAKLCVPAAPRGPVAGLPRRQGA